MVAWMVEWRQKQLTKHSLFEQTPQKSITANFYVPVFEYFFPFEQPYNQLLFNSHLQTNLDYFLEDDEACFVPKRAVIKDILNEILQMVVPDASLQFSNSSLMQTGEECIEYLLELFMCRKSLQNVDLLDPLLCFSRMNVRMGESTFRQLMKPWMTLLSGISLLSCWSTFSSFHRKQSFNWVSFSCLFESRRVLP